MMNVSSWSIKNPIPAVMLFVLLTFAGFLSFNSMKVQNFPDIDLPTVSVVASLPGAAPAQGLYLSRVEYMPDVVPAELVPPGLPYFVGR